MITINSITKNFENFKAVNNLNLTINSWECFWLLWRNWAWKTTTIKMIVWLLKPDNWTILFDGKNIYENTIEIKSNIAYIPDIPYVYDKLTWMEFIFFVWHMYWLDKPTISKRVQKFIEAFNLEDVINKKTEEYSHGMRQKLVFSASLVHQPKYLIIDEPMVWLDPQAAKIIKDILKKLAKQQWCTIILTTHQLYVAAEICDRVGIIHNWELLCLFENKNEFWDLEEKFISLTWWYEKSLETLFE